MWDIVDRSQQDGDKAKGAVAIDAFPGLGKTTAVLAFARQFHRREITEHGRRTSSSRRAVAADGLYCIEVMAAGISMHLLLAGGPDGWIYKNSGD